MVRALEQAIAEVERLPAEDQEQIGRTPLSHVEKLRALRAEIDKGIYSKQLEKYTHRLRLIKRIL